MALSEAQRLERAARIKQLREESAYTQPALAEQIGVSLRAYQRWEEGGGIEWEHLEKLADIHDVDVAWIHRGAERSATPDLLGTPLTQLVEAVDQLRVELESMKSELLAEIGEVRTAQEARSSQRASAGRAQEGTGK